MQTATPDVAPPAADRTFGWGIVGTGTIARQFAGDLALLPDSAIAAVQSRSIEQARRFAAEFAAGAAYDRLDAFLDDPAIAAVYVATPNMLHAEQALRAIAAGKPVLVEKPLTTTAEAARAIAAAAREAGVFAMEALWTRFLPAVVALRRHLAGGRIGAIRRISAELAYRRDEDAESRFFDPAQGGGALLDLGVYPLSLAVHLLGTPERVEGSWRAARGGVDLSSEIVLHYPQATAEIACGFDRDGGNQFLVEGERGAIRLDAPFLKARRLTLYGSGAGNRPWRGLGLRPDGRVTKLLDRLPMPGRAREAFGFDGGGLQFQAQAVMEAVRAGLTEHPSMPLADSAAVLDIVGTVLARPPVPG